VSLHDHGGQTSPLGATGLVAMGLFLLILVVGFIYEWKKGALEWD
jgi:NADH-quinone oxidoreductase subunit A